MKRIWSCLLALFLLAGCGGEAQESAGEAPAEEAPAAGSYSLEMITEWAEYDPSVDTIWCVLSHEGEGDPLEFGSEYRLEVRTDSGWEQVPFAEGTGWDDILYTLPAGESWAFPCVLYLFGCDFTEGTYRVVKEVAVLPGETEFTLPVEAEFTLAEGARISAETPYGFVGAGRGRRGGVHGGGDGEPGPGGGISGQGVPGHPLPAADGPGLL